MIALAMVDYSFQFVGRETAHEQVTPNALDKSSCPLTFLMCLFGREWYTGLLNHSHQAKAVTPGAMVGWVSIAIRRPAEAGVVVPTAAPMRPIQADKGPHRLHCSACGGGLIPVLHPLPDIAMHVIESPGIRLYLPSWVCPIVSIVPIPGIQTELARILAKAPSCRGPDASCVLPLCLRRQAVHHPAFLGVEPTDACLHVVPGDLFHRSVGMAGEAAGIAPHHPLPPPLRHLVLAKIKGLYNTHRLYWLFMSPSLAVVRPHLKRPCRDEHELHAQAVMPHWGWWQGRESRCTGEPTCPSSVPSGSRPRG